MKGIFACVAGVVILLYQKDKPIAFVINFIIGIAFLNASKVSSIDPGFIRGKLCVPPRCTNSGKGSHRC